MTVTQTTYGGFTADELIGQLTDAQAPAKILNNVHEMMVEWLRNHRDASLDEHHESVYLTYVILKSFFGSLEKGGADE